MGAQSLSFNITCAQGSLLARQFSCGSIILPCTIAQEVYIAAACTHKARLVERRTCVRQTKGWLRHQSLSAYTTLRQLHCVILQNTLRNHRHTHRRRCTPGRTRGIDTGDWTRRCQIPDGPWVYCGLSANGGPNIYSIQWQRWVCGLSVRQGNGKVRGRLPVGPYFRPLTVTQHL